MSGAQMPHLILAIRPAAEMTPVRTAGTIALSAGALDEP
jgi:hypothetical protein